jgi:phage shock protein PspC (stress-responsive transcriptional regulator)
MANIELFETFKWVVIISTFFGWIFFILRWFLGWLMMESETKEEK